MTERYPITEEGFKNLEAELAECKSKRALIVQEISEARAHGDLSENAEYHAAKEKQGFNEDRIRRLEMYISKSDVIDVSKYAGSSVVMFGATVTVKSLDDEVLTFKIVGANETDADSNKISFSSPLAKAVIRKEVGDLVEVKLPKGIVEYEITDLKY